MINKNSIIQILFSNKNLQITKYLENGISALLENTDNNELYYLMPNSSGRTYLILSAIYIFLSDKEHAVIICDRIDNAKQIKNIFDSYIDLIGTTSIYETDKKIDKITIFRENSLPKLDNVDSSLTIFFDIRNIDFYVSYKQKHTTKTLLISSENVVSEIKIIPDYVVTINDLIKDEYVKNYNQLQDFKKVSNKLPKLSSGENFGLAMTGGIATISVPIIGGIIAGQNKKRLKENVEKQFEAIHAEYKRILEDELSKIQTNEQIYNQYTSKSLINDNEINILQNRKKQLVVFEKLLYDVDYFDNQKAKKKGSERVWQDFFEKNTWIFGYGLTYVFNTSLQDKKLEQTVSGFTFNNSGKRTDALLKTKGIINSLVFCEIKTHKTALIKSQMYRAECWASSDELTGGVIQVQRTVQKSLENIRTKTEIKNDNGELIGENLYLYQPKSYLIIGTLSEFVDDNGNVNEDKFASFEIFRRNLTNPTIITFDELYERAKHIVLQI